MKLADKVKKSKEIIIQTAKRWGKKEIALAWTGGKDSTVVLHLVREVFNGEVPFKVMFNDSTLEFPEIYKFIKEISQKWRLDLLHIKHLAKDLKAYHKTKTREEKMEIMRLAKINVLDYALAKYKFQAFISGIRWDEHKARSREKYFSPRETHTRVHPILHFKFDDIWDYIRTYQVPYVNLYDKGYKSLGEKPFTKPANNPNAGERSGREATKEKTMTRLRKLGYW